MKILHNGVEKGIVVGNIYNKYESNNPVARILLKNFRKNLFDLINYAHPETIHEAGCGEGYWTIDLRKRGYAATGSDFSNLAIDAARENYGNRGDEIFFVSSIDDLELETPVDLILACEVLEHLQNPSLALEKLASLTKSWFLCSVPREPLWRMLNMARGKYWRDLGNTPGHIQHWSKSGFINLLEKYFNVVDVRSPLPWTMALCRKK